MGRKYKVIALSLGGLRNKVFNSGEVIDESAFGSQNIAQLVKGGFIKENSVKTASVKDTVEMIQNAESIEGVDKIIGDDSRAGVIKAGEDKIEEFLMTSIEEAQNESQLSALNQEIMNEDVLVAFEAKKEEFTA